MHAKTTSRFSRRFMVPVLGRAASRWRRTTAALGAAAASLALLTTPGCVVPGLIGAMGQSFESQKLIEVAAQYSDLADKSVAVVVNVGLDIRWSDPGMAIDITNQVSRFIALNVEGARVMNPAQVLLWQDATPQWDALPLGEVAASLNVDRVVYVDIYEYRLNPPGNRFLWEGVCAASVGVIERDGFDTDSFADTFEVRAEFPDAEGVSRDMISGNAIAAALKSRFIQRTAWLFYKHEEPKYPDLYNPAVDR